MPDWREIFQKHAAEYDQLVAREDYQKNLSRVLNQILPFDGSDVVELGAGTGRLTCMLAPLVNTILAFDNSQHMLEAASAKLKRMGLRNWRVGVADNRNLPVGDRIADVAIAGWTLCCLAIWQPETWRAELGQALFQMKRILRPGGVVIILETLGTGQAVPQPPREELAVYYAWLEQEHGFSHTWIRTDFQFESLTEAESLIRFFFGDVLAQKVADENSVVLPECTGVWWLRTE
jgi:ubiquinone/menaquinone biosynthesis C-methylase UbiE